jgi:putative nucleotidyltransferase with HDIG domain
MITHPSLRRRIVLPFVVLVLFVGVVGTAILSAQVGGTTGATFDNGLVQQSLLANDRLAALENDRLQQLRAAADTAGIDAAIAANDATTASRLVSPIVGNAQPEHLVIRVLGATGGQLVALRRETAGVTAFTDTASYASTPAVVKALLGERDALGDKYLFLANEGSQPMIYWVAPVRPNSTSVAGAVLLGQQLREIATSIHVANASQLSFFDPAGRVLTSSLTSTAPLQASVMQQVTLDTPVRSVMQRSDHTYRMLVSDWTMRGTSLGYLGVAMNADGLADSLSAVRIFLVLLFTAFALAALLIGVGLADRITRPVEQLVASMRVVSAGDYSLRVPVGPAGSTDEIGYLARTFNEMAAALEQRRREREEGFFRNLEALARAIDARDPYTFEHSARVAAISKLLAEAMGLRAAELEVLNRSGLLHDIGKIGVPDRILGKTTPLTDEEWSVIRRHPVIGHDMLKDVPFLGPSLDGVRHHHERWDGEGYPDGLKETAIPQLARIVAVADAFDAMTSDRPYRKGFSFEFAARTIVAEAGRQFDPDVVKVFAARKAAIFTRLEEMGKKPAPHASDIRLDEAA